MTSGTTILNVDDNEAGRFLVTQILRGAGFEVIEARTGGEALRFAETMPVDLVLLDIGLPDVDGFEVCRRIKTNPKTSAIAVVHLSATRVGVNDRVVGLEGGADGYIAEPVSNAELIATVRATLRLRDAEQNQRFLADASVALGSALAVGDALARAARAAVPYLADWCVVHELDDSGALTAVVLAHCSAAKEAAGRAAFGVLDTSVDTIRGVVHVARSGAAERLGFIDDPSVVAAAIGIDDPAAVAELGAISCMSVPLRARGRIMGVMTLVSGVSGRRFRPADLTLAEDLASRVAMVVDNSRLYEEARRAVQTRENLLAIVSHDLKSPLHVIQLSIEQMMRSVPEGAQQARKHAGAILRASQRMNRMIHDLLDLAQSDAGELAIEVAPVDAMSLLREAAESFGSIAQAKSISLGFSPSERSVDVLCDRGRIEQVVTNLVDNAIKFTPSGGTIELSTAIEPDGIVRFSVRDTGRGIGAAQLERVFDRYWQAAKERRDGAGLGLSIAKAIVDRHGGRIWAESEQDKGTTVSFTLRAATPDP